MKLTKEIENILFEDYGDLLQPKLDERKEQISKITKEYILKEIIKEEEPQHPSGMDRQNIDTRNDHRESQRARLEKDFE